MANFGISQVQYDQEDKVIEMVRVHDIADENIGYGEVWKRHQVLEQLDAGKNFITIIRGQDGAWMKGQHIHRYTVNGKSYLRTDSNETDRDNLEQLPNF